MKEQASTATTTTHPLFMIPFTPEELKHKIKKLHPDKSPGPSGITNRMLQAGEHNKDKALISRLTTHTELLNTRTHNQLGTKPDTQTHDATYSLVVAIEAYSFILGRSLATSCALFSS